MTVFTSIAVNIKSVCFLLFFFRIYCITGRQILMIVDVQATLICTFQEQKTKQDNDV